jgi:hypothetical protein
MHDLRRTYHRLRNHFGRTRWIFLVTVVIWNLISMHLGTVLVSVQDRCTVCDKHQLEIILNAPDGTPSDEAQVDARFSLFGDSANLDAR